MSTEDDEALAWAGDNDERLTTGSTSKSPVRKRRASPSSSSEVVAPMASGSATDVSAQRVVGESWTPSEALPSTDTSGAEEEDAPKGLSSAALVTFGILGGIYLLFTVAWVLTAVRNPIQIEDALGSFTYNAGLWMASLAAPAWFGAVIMFGKARSLWWRFSLLLFGAALFIPWPFLTWAGYRA